MALDKCTICGKATSNKCSRCRAAAYCSGVCQKNDFALHKLLCGQYQAFLATRPVPTEEDISSGDSKPITYKAAILFPMDSNHPKLIWLKVQIRSEYESDCEEEEFPEYHHWEDLQKSLSDYMEWGQPMPHSRNGQDLKVYMAETAFGAYPLTQSLLKLNAGYDAREHGSLAAAPCAGNLVLVNFTTSIVEHPTEPECYDPAEKEAHNDVNLADLRYAFDYLTRRNYIFELDKPNPYVIRNPGRWFKAVKISCDGDIKLDGKKKFTEVSIHRHHPIFRHDDGESGISKHLGFTLLVKRIPPNPDWPDKMMRLPRSQRFHPYENHAAVSLMINVDVASKHWRFAPEIWDKGADPMVLVARKDMKDLTAHQVEVLADYCQHEVLWNMGVVTERYMEGGSGGEDIYWVIDKETGEPRIPFPKTRQKFLDKYLVFDKFAEYFEEFKKKKIAEGDAAWATAVVPPQGSVPDEIEETKEEEHESMLRMMGAL